MARQQHDDDSDIFEVKNGVKILRDGRSFRTPMMMRDAMQRDIAAHAATLDATATFDASMRRRPGFRYGDTAANDARERAYDRYEKEMSQAWRGGDAKGGREGGICTVRNEQYPDDFGSPGHYDADGVCVPDRLRDDSRRDALPVRDEREVEYAA